MDMKFHWLRDREAQGQFRFYWRDGPSNDADYPSKNHCPAHHQRVRPRFLTPRLIVDELRKMHNKKPHIFRASERVC